MTKSLEIIVIFKNNLHFLEINKFLVNGGYKISRKKDFKFFKKENRKKLILIVEVDNEKNMRAVSSFMDENHNEVYIICILKNSFKVPSNYKNLKTLVQPFTFNELLKNLSIFEKNLQDHVNSFKLIDLDYFPNHSKFFDKRNNVFKGKNNR